VIANGRTLAPKLEPAAHTSLVVPISIAETPFQVGFLARDDAVADGDSQREREEQGPRASCGYTDAAVDRSILGTGSGNGSRRSETRPSRRAARKRRSGRAMTPAVSVSVTCCPAGSLHMPAPADGGLRGLRKRQLGCHPSKLTTMVSTGEAGTAKGNAGDGVGTTQDRGGPKDRGGPNR